MVINKSRKKSKDSINNSYDDKKNSYRKHEVSINERYNNSRSNEMDEQIDDEPVSDNEKRLSKSQTKTNSNNRFSEHIEKNDDVQNVYTD